MATKIDKAIVGFIITLLTYWFAQSGIEPPAEVTGALEVLLDWVIPILLAVGGGFLVWLTPNRKATPKVRNLSGYTGPESENSE